MRGHSNLYFLSALSQAAYAFFVDLSENAVRNAVRNTAVLRSDVFGEAQAIAVFGDDTYNIVSHAPNDLSGFSATLLNDASTDEFVLAIRGSEGDFLDFIPTSGANPDRHQANADIVLPARGIARDQLVSLYNYYRRLITPVGQEVPLYRLVDTATQPESGSYYTYESRISELLPPTTRYVYLVFDRSKMGGEAIGMAICAPFKRARR